MLHGLPGSVMGAAAGSVVSLFVTLAFGAYWHKFTFPLSHLLRIGGATALMLAALSLIPVAPTALSLAVAVALGGVVYAAALALVYPEGVAAIKAKFDGLRRT